MAKNRKSTFNMLPDDVQASIVTQEQPVTQKEDVTSVTLKKDVTHPSNVTHIQSVTQPVEVTSVTHEERVTRPDNVTHPNQMEDMSQPLQPNSIPHIVLPIHPAKTDDPKTRVYVNVKTDNYEFAKRKVGTHLATLQQYFDALIEYDIKYGIIEYEKK